MANIVQGFNTSQGLAQYDYNSLANLPELPSEYELPIAGSVLGGVKNGGNVVVSNDGTMNVQIEQPATSSLDFDMLRDSKKRPGRLMVSFMDDDCRVEVVRGNNNEGSLEDLINEKEIPYTLSCAPDNINRKDVDAEGNVTKEYMTLDDLKRMVNNGVTVSSHARKEYNMSQFGTVEDFIEDIKICNNKFTEWGIPVSTMAYPQGDYVDDYLPDLKKYYNMGFTVENGINEIPYESYYMKRVGLFNNKKDGIKDSDGILYSSDNLAKNFDEYHWLNNKGTLQSQIEDSRKGRFVSQPIEVKQGERYKVICSAVWGGSCWAFWGPGGKENPLSGEGYNYVDKTNSESGQSVEQTIIVPEGAKYLVISYNSIHNITPGIYRSELDTAKNWVDQLLKKGSGWLIFMTHAWYSNFSIATLGQIIDYIKDQGVEIVDIHDAIKTTGNIIEVGRIKKPFDYSGWPFFVMDCTGEIYTNSFNKYSKNNYKILEPLARGTEGLSIGNSGKLWGDGTNKKRIASSEIFVRPGEKYKIICASSYSNLPYCFYTSPIGAATMTIIKDTYLAGITEGSQDNHIVQGDEITIPEGVKYMRIATDLSIQPEGYKIVREEYAGEVESDSIPDLFIAKLGKESSSVSNQYYVNKTAKSISQILEKKRTPILIDNNGAFYQFVSSTQDEAVFSNSTLTNENGPQLTIKTFRVTNNLTAMLETVTFALATK